MSNFNTDDLKSGVNPGIRVMFLGMSQSGRRSLISGLASLIDAPKIEAIPNPFAVIDPSAPDDIVVDVVRSMLIECVNPLINDTPAPPAQEGDVLQGDHAQDQAHLHLAEDPGVLAASLLAQAGDVCTGDEVGALNFSDEDDMSGDLLTGGRFFKKVGAAAKKVKNVVQKVAASPIVKKVIMPALKTKLALAFPAVAGALAVAGKIKDKIASAKAKAASIRDAIIAPSPVVASTNEVKAVASKEAAATVPAGETISVPTSAVARAILDLMSTGDTGDYLLGDLSSDCKPFSIDRTITGDFLKGDVFTGAPKLLTASRAKIAAAGRNALNWMKANKGKVTAAGAGVGGTAALVAASNLMQTDPEKAMDLVANEIPGGSVYTEGATDPNLIAGGESAAEGPHTSGHLGVGSAIFVMRKGIAGPRSTSHLNDIANQGNAIYSDWKASFLGVNPTFLVGDMGSLTQVEKAILILLHGLPKNSVSVVPQSCLPAFEREMRGSVPVLSPTLTREITDGLRSAILAPGSVRLTYKQADGTWKTANTPTTMQANKFIPMEYNHMINSHLGDLMTGAPLLLKAASSPALRPGGIVSTRGGQLVSLGGGAVAGVKGVLGRAIKPASSRVKTLFGRAAAAAGLGGAATAGAYGVKSALDAVTGTEAEKNVIQPLAPVILDGLSEEDRQRLSTGKMLIIPFIGDLNDCYGEPGDSESTVGRTIIVGDIAVDAGSLMEEMEYA